MGQCALFSRESLYKAGVSILAGRFHASLGAVQGVPVGMGQCALFSREVNFFCPILHHKWTVIYKQFSII